ncbi:hypothetical protein BDZ94DRAFT_1315904 [Collybia nuda]|uniref:Uncharacterized protein n=1 Tax=Collybia nuda TaxID=64659 RepID=A0A9P5XU25_9AGAR|nr:hypothetical protein BDZ94DRAFT_1315904 [Collybia nuda]
MCLVFKFTSSPKDTPEYVNWSGGNKPADIEWRVQHIWAEDSSFGGLGASPHGPEMDVQDGRLSKNVALMSTSKQQQRGSNRHLDGFLYAKLDIHGPSAFHGRAPNESLRSVTGVLRLYAEEGRVRDLEKIMTTCLTTFPTPQQRHLHIKAHIRATSPNTLPTSALDMLHSYESQSHPAPVKTYTSVISTFFSTKTMIRACASPISSSRPSEPERALDLWTEMTVDRRLLPTIGAYDAIILASQAVWAAPGSALYSPYPYPGVELALRRARWARLVPSASAPLHLRSVPPRPMVLDLLDGSSQPPPHSGHLDNLTRPGGRIVVNQQLDLPQQMSTGRHLRTLLPLITCRQLDRLSDGCSLSGLEKQDSISKSAERGLGHGGWEVGVQAFQLTKQMLDSHRDACGYSAFTPDRKTFCALLEGARRIGDLSRARWILAEIVNGRGNGDGTVVEEGVDEEVMMHIFHTYAAYRPPFQRTLVTGKAPDTSVPSSQ